MSLGNLDALGAIATVLNPNNNDEFPDGTVEQETIIVTSADGQILEEAYIITQEHPHQTQDTGQLQQSEEMEGETFCDLDQSTKEAGSNFLCSQQLQPRLIKNELKSAWETQLSESGFVACSVPGCQMKYSTVASFEDHYKFCTGENGQGVETCEYCNCEFLTCIQGIEDHVRKEHPTEINDYCAKRVARKIIKECREKEQRAKELKEAKALELKRERQNNRNSYQRNRPTCYAKKTPAKSDSDNSKDGSDRKVRFQKVVSVIHTAKQGPENDNDEGDVDDPGMTPTKDKARKGPPPRKDTTEVLQLARNWGVQRKTYSRSGSSADMPPGSRDSSIFDDDPEPETSTIPEKKVIEPPEPVVETPTVVQQQIQQDEEVVTFFNEDEDGNVLIPIETEGCVTVGNNEDTPEAEDENYQLVIVTGESGESQYIVIDDSISQALADGVTLNDNSELQGSENSCFNVVTMPDEEIEVASTYDAEVEVTGEEVAETVPNDVPETATIQDIENDVGQVVIPSSQPSEPIVIPAKGNKKVAFVESKPSEEATDDLLSSMPSADKWVERNRKSVENKKVVIRKRKVKTTPHMESGSEDSNDPTVDRFQLPTPKDLASINIGDDFLPPNLDKLLEFGSGRSEKKKTDISSEGGGSSPIRQSDVNGSWVEPPPRTASPKPSAKTHTAIILKNSVPSIPKMNPSNVKNVSVSTALKSAFVQEKAKLVEVVSQPTKVVTKTVPAQTASVSQIPQPAQASSKPHIVHLSQTPRNAQAAQTPAQKLQSPPSTQVPKSGLPLSDKSITSDNQNRALAEKLEPSTANISKTAFVQENAACTPTCANKNSSMSKEVTKVITTNIESSPHHQEESRTSNTSESSSRCLPQMKKITSFQGLSGLTGNPHIKIYTPNSDGTLAPLEDFSILSSNPQIRIMTPETDGTLKPMIVGDNKDLILKTVQKMIATGSSSGTIKTHDNKISVLPEIGDGGQQHEIDIDTAAAAAAVGLEENEENNSRSAIEPLANSDGQTSNSIAIHEAKNEELIRIENELMKGPLTPSSVENENSIDVNSINTVGSSVTVETVVKRKRGRPPRIDSSTPKVLPTNTAPVHVLRASKPVSPPPSKIFKPNIGRNDTRMTLVNNSSDLSLLESTMDESLSNDFGNIKSTSNVSKQTSFASVLDSVSDSDSSNLTPASRRGGPAMRGGRYAKRRGGRRGRYAGRWRKPETPPADLPRQQMEIEADSYKCSACKQVFLIKSLARNHIISRHNGMARLNDDTPMTESEINAALRMVLKTKRSLVCLNQDCGRVFRSGPGYLNHRKLCGVEVKSNNSKLRSANVVDDNEVQNSDESESNSEVESGVDSVDYEGDIASSDYHPDEPPGDVETKNVITQFISDYQSIGLSEVVSDDHEEVVPDSVIVCGEYPQNEDIVESERVSLNQSRELPEFDSARVKNVANVELTDNYHHDEGQNQELSSQHETEYVHDAPRVVTEEISIESKATNVTLSNPEVFSDYHSRIIVEEEKFIVDESEEISEAAADNVLVIPIDSDNWSQSCVVGDNFIFDEPQSFVVGAFDEIATSDNGNSCNESELQIGELSEAPVLVTSFKSLAEQAVTTGDKVSSEDVSSITQTEVIDSGQDNTKETRLAFESVALLNEDKQSKEILTPCEDGGTRQPISTQFETAVAVLLEETNVPKSIEDTQSVATATTETSFDDNISKISDSTFTTSIGDRGEDSRISSLQVSPSPMIEDKEIIQADKMNLQSLKADRDKTAPLIITASPAITKDKAVSQSLLKTDTSSRGDKISSNSLLISEKTAEDKLASTSISKTFENSPAVCSESIETVGGIKDLEPSKTQTIIVDVTQTPNREREASEFLRSAMSFKDLKNSTIFSPLRPSDETSKEQTLEPRLNIAETETESKTNEDQSLSRKSHPRKQVISIKDLKEDETFKGLQFEDEEPKEPPKKPPRKRPPRLRKPTTKAGGKKGKKVSKKPAEASSEDSDFLIVPGQSGNEDLPGTRGKPKRVTRNSKGGLESPNVIPEDTVSASSKSQAKLPATAKRVTRNTKRLVADDNDFDLTSEMSVTSNSIETTPTPKSKGQSSSKKLSESETRSKRVTRSSVPVNDVEITSLVSLSEDETNTKSPSNKKSTVQRNLMKNNELDVLDDQCSSDSEIIINTRSPCKQDLKDLEDQLSSTDEEIFIKSNVSALKNPRKRVTRKGKAMLEPENSTSNDDADISEVDDHENVDEPRSSRKVIEKRINDRDENKGDKLSEFKRVTRLNKTISHEESSMDVSIEEPQKMAKSLRGTKGGFKRNIKPTDVDVQKPFNKSRSGTKSPSPKKDGKIITRNSTAQVTSEDSEIDVENYNSDKDVSKDQSTSDNPSGNRITKNVASKSEFRVAVKMTRARTNFALAKLKRTLAMQIMKPTRKTADFKAKLTSKNATTSMVKRQSKVLKALTKQKLKTRGEQGKVSSIASSVSSNKSKKVEPPVVKSKKTDGVVVSRRKRSTRNESGPKGAGKKKINVVSTKKRGGIVARQSKLSLARTRSNKLLASAKKSPPSQMKTKNPKLFFKRSNAKLNLNKVKSANFNKDASKDSLRKVSTTTSKSLKSKARPQKHLTKTKAMAVVKKSKKEVVYTKLDNEITKSLRSAGWNEVSDNVTSPKSVHDGTKRRNSMENQSHSGSSKPKSKVYELKKSSTITPKVSKSFEHTLKLTRSSTSVQFTESSTRSVRKSTQLSTKSSVVDAAQRKLLQQSNEKKKSSPTIASTPSPPKKSTNVDDTEKSKPPSRRSSLDQSRVKSLRNTVERQRLASASYIATKKVTKPAKNHNVKPIAKTTPKTLPRSSPNVTLKHKSTSSSKSSFSIRKTARVRKLKVFFDELMSIQDLERRNSSENEPSTSNATRNQTEPVSPSKVRPYPSEKFKIERRIRSKSMTAKLNIGRVIKAKAKLQAVKSSKKRIGLALKTQYGRNRSRKVPLLKASASRESRSFQGKTRSSSLQALEKRVPNENKKAFRNERRKSTDSNNSRKVKKSKTSDEVSLYDDGLPKAFMKINSRVGEEDSESNVERNDKDIELSWESFEVELAAGINDKFADDSRNTSSPIAPAEASRDNIYEAKVEVADIPLVKAIQDKIGSILRNPDEVEDDVIFDSVVIKNPPAIPSLSVNTEKYQPQSRATTLSPQSPRLGSISPQSPRSKTMSPPSARPITLSPQMPRLKPISPTSQRFQSTSPSSQRSSSTSPQLQRFNETPNESQSQEQPNLIKVCSSKINAKIKTRDLRMGKNMVAQLSPESMTRILSVNPQLRNLQPPLSHDMIRPYTVTPRSASQSSIHVKSSVVKPWQKTTNFSRESDEAKLAMNQLKAMSRGPKKHESPEKSLAVITSTSTSNIIPKISPVELSDTQTGEMQLILNVVADTSNLEVPEENLLVEVSDNVEVEVSTLSDDTLFTAEKSAVDSSESPADDDETSTSKCEVDDETSTSKCEVDDETSTSKCEVDDETSTSKCEVDDETSTSKCEVDDETSTSKCEVDAENTLFEVLDNVEVEVTLNDGISNCEKSSKCESIETELCNNQKIVYDETEVVPETSDVQKRPRSLSESQITEHALNTEDIRASGSQSTSEVCAGVSNKRKFIGHPCSAVKKRRVSCPVLKHKTIGNHSNIRCKRLLLTTHGTKNYKFSARPIIDADIAKH